MIKKKNIPKKKIVGIDPGTNLLGYAVIEAQKENIVILEMGVIKMNHLKDPHQKLKKIFEKIQKIVQHYRPHEMAIEAPFFGKNVQSMLKLGRAQGVAIAAGIVNNIPITEYSPKKVKQAITGNGNASKEQVAAMLQNITKQKFEKGPADITDALAIAVCHHFNSKNLLNKGKKYKNWTDFIKDNPDKKV